MEGLECMEITVCNGTVQSLSIRINGQANNADVTVRVYCRPPSQDNYVDELFFEELRDASKPTAVVFIGDFSLPEINWKHHTAGTTKVRRFLKDLNDNFMEQVLRDPTWKDFLLDLLLVNRVDFMSQVVISHETRWKELHN
ncbi:hypothetical protein HGM15179_020129 [Zosterops borbonicus]|uniref:Endonuclease/exonuclease/phosphatase domain-containing protein n=1 Tax=Zosterops borbonicus TaxID=364589 RepID=A0A8K1D8L5_9PASS|nr:hypothetical protein HGM15179_020129 [Zosterops borbonicus]